MDNNVNNMIKKIFDDSFEIKIELLEGGMIPVKAKPSDAGFDVYATYDFSIAPGEIAKHPLNFKMALPIGAYAEMKERSGLGLKGMVLTSKVIDRGYRGIPHVVAGNISKETIYFKKGDRIAQMIIYPHNENYYFTQVDEVSTNTDRGSGGFGSSGN